MPSTSTSPNPATPHRLILERWHATHRRSRTRRAATWIRATLAPNPLAAHARRTAQLPPDIRERHLTRRGLDRY
jgi:hypothetical protein